MSFLVFLELVLPGEGFLTVMEGTMMFLPLMFGAFTMAFEVALPLRFVVAFTTITRGTVGSELDVGRIMSMSCERS